jgi:hypothetical protein
MNDDWICAGCAALQGARIPEDHVASWHMGQCDWCGETKSVTEPREFRPRPRAEPFADGNLIAPWPPTPGR